MLVFEGDPREVKNFTPINYRPCPRKYAQNGQVFGVETKADELTNLLQLSSGESRLPVSHAIPQVPRDFQIAMNAHMQDPTP